MLRTLEIDLRYQPPLDAPPPTAGDLYANACSADEATVNHWREIWVNNIKAAKDRFGVFADRSIGQFYGLNAQKGALVLGSGPSLKTAIPALKENASSASKLLTVSCLHNFGFFEDEECHADFYVSLDSGKIVVDDMSEGRKLPSKEYWERTKGKKLLAYIGSDPSLFDLWQGEVYLFNCLIPDFEVKKELDQIERFTHYVSCGGNALGGCMYIAKALMGSDAIHYVGADFCFDYNNRFHSYDTHYDRVGNYLVWPDIYGIPRKTWGSYLNFKYFFDHIAMTVPGRWINCSDGLLGAYQGGNLRQFTYQSLDRALDAYRMHERVYLEFRDENKKMVGKEKIDLKELFSNPQFEKDIVIF